MAIGLFINLAFVIPVWANPTPIQWMHIFLSSIFGLMAQFFITHGYKYIEATKGSLVSSIRIVIAMVLGVLLFADNITLQIIIGTILILGAQYSVIGSQIWAMKNAMMRKR